MFLFGYIKQKHIYSRHRLFMSDLFILINKRD